MDPYSARKKDNWQALIYRKRGRRNPHYSTYASQFCASYFLFLLSCFYRQYLPYPLFSTAFLVLKHAMCSFQSKWCSSFEFCILAPHFARANYFSFHAMRFVSLGHLEMVDRSLLHKLRAWMQASLLLHLIFFFSTLSASHNLRSYNGSFRRHFPCRNAILFVTLILFRL